MKKLKKKGFVIDKITEDSFYENLLLGLSSILRTCQFVTQVKLERLEPATLEEVKLWEVINELCLPEDLRNFYLSTNGFSYTYKFQYGDDDDSVIAGIEVNPLYKLEKIQATDAMYTTDAGMKIVTPYSKIHVVTRLDDNCVVLARFNPVAKPTFWLYYKSKFFYFMCEDIATYLRMAVAHVGAPGWQLAILKANLPEWSAELIQILAPGILDSRPLFENKSEVNKIDCDIFNIDSDLELTSDSEKVAEEKTKKAKPKSDFICNKR